MDRKKEIYFLHCPNVTDRYLISPRQTKKINEKNPGKQKNPKSPRNFTRAGLGPSRSRRKRKVSEKVQRESESGGSWLGTSVVAKQNESLQRKKIGIRLLGNGKEDKEGKFPQTNNSKQKINQSIKHSIE